MKFQTSLFIPLFILIVKYKTLLVTGLPIAYSCITNPEQFRLLFCSPLVCGSLGELTLFLIRLLTARSALSCPEFVLLTSIRHVQLFWSGLALQVQHNNQLQLLKLQAWHYPGLGPPLLPCFKAIFCIPGWYSILSFTIGF